MSDPVTWGAVVGVGGILIAWLANKLWRAHRHEMAGLHGVDANLLRLVTRLDEEIKQREKDDRSRFERFTEDAHARHEEVLVELGQLSAAIAANGKH